MSDYPINTEGDFVDDSYFRSENKLTALSLTQESEDKLPEVSCTMSQEELMSAMEERKRILDSTLNIRAISKEEIKLACVQGLEQASAKPMNDDSLRLLTDLFSQLIVSNDVDARKESITGIICCLRSSEMASDISETQAAMAAAISSLSDMVVRTKDAMEELKTTTAILREQNATGVLFEASERASTRLRKLLVRWCALKVAGRDAFRLPMDAITTLDNLPVVELLSLFDVDHEDEQCNQAILDAVIELMRRGH